MESTEAKSSVTYSITSKDGFNILFTVRDEKASDLLDKMAIIEPALLKKGYIPQVKKSFGGGEKKPIEYVPDRKCPKCGSQLVYQTTATGKKMIKCSTQKWNPITKQSEGCPFIEWQN